MKRKQIIKTFLLLYVIHGETQDRWWWWVSVSGKRLMLKCRDDTFLTKHFLHAQQKLLFHLTKYKWLWVKKYINSFEARWSLLTLIVNCLFKWKINQAQQDGLKHTCKWLGKKIFELCSGCSFIFWISVDKGEVEWGFPAQIITNSTDIYSNIYTGNSGMCSIGGEEEEEVLGDTMEDTEERLLGYMKVEYSDVILRVERIW